MKREVSLAVLLILCISLALSAPPAPPQDNPSIGGTDNTDTQEQPQEQQNTTPPPDPAAPGNSEQPTQEITELRERIQELETQQRQTPSLQTTPLWIQLTAISSLLIALIAAGLAGYLYYKEQHQSKQPTNNPLAQYVQRCRAQGYNDQQIRTVLRRSGYPDKKITNALNT